MGSFLKLAFNDIALVIVTVHGPVPEQPRIPDQPANAEPASAAAVTVTTVPDAKLLVQFAVQFASEPRGEKVTVPEPVPVLR